MEITINFYLYGSTVKKIKAVRGRVKRSYGVIEYKLQDGEMEGEKGNLNIIITFHMKPESTHVKLFQNSSARP